MRNLTFTICLFLLPFLLKAQEKFTIDLSSDIGLYNSSLDAQTLLNSLGYIDEDQKQAILKNMDDENFYYVDINNVIKFTNRKGISLAFGNHVSSYGIFDGELVRLGLYGNTSSSRVMVLYFLYRLHEEKGNIDFAKDYKRMLLKEFPQSDYAKLIKDPDYAEEMVQANSLLNTDYEKAHQYYLQSQFDACISLCERVNKNNPNNALYPNFDFLKTMAKGFGMTKSNYINALTLIVEKYPKHQVAESAKEILVYLKIEELEVDKTALSVGDSPYLDKPKAGHYFILLFKEFDLEVSIAKSTLSNYHAEYYRLDRLNVSDLLFDEHTHMITVREFPNKNKAMAYYKAFVEGDVRGIFGDDYDVFVIASPNFPTFFKNRDVEGYKKTFQEYYLNKQ